MMHEKLLKEIDGGNVLDVGCGPGQFTGTLAGSLRSFKTITGVDVDEDSLKEARSNFPGKSFIFIRSGSQDLPFQNDHFDMVVISNALHHVEDPEASLAEMKRVLKSGGYFLVNELLRDELTDAQESHMLHHHLRQEIDKILGVNHNPTYHRADLINLVNNVGLQERVIAEFSPDDGMARDSENMLEFTRKLDLWIEALDGHPEKSKFRERGEALKNRIKEFGISRPPQMLILGKKM